MARRILIVHLVFLWFVSLLLGQPASVAESATVLDNFIVTESAQHHEGDVLPTSRPVDSVFGSGQSVLDLPRSITVLTPELMSRFVLENLGDLGRIGAGTQVANYFGIPGTPYIRGVKASTFFNGMARAYQRNEMPVSFGSLEALDIVKGPTPSHLGPAPEGGYVNFIPKSPYFDGSRGSLGLTVGENNQRRIQLDYGSPVLVGDWPAAYRVSLTVQDAGTYWRNVDNDYVSLYAALKIRPRSDFSVFTGAEYYDFHSNENPGWNRVTQDLIDHGQYIIGEPQNIVSSAWGGIVNRSLAVFPGAYFGQAANFRALILPADIAVARIAPDLLNLMEDRRTSDGGYRYTNAYFAAGGQALTTKIDGSTVLSDPNDHADSRDLLWFLDLVSTQNPDRTVTWKTLLEALETDKHSSYGYAIADQQLVIENKFLVEQLNLQPADTTVTYGASLRYNYGWMVQDFGAEPFNRRDISLPSISANSKVPTGGDHDPNGLNLWATSIGGSTVSTLWQAAMFGFATTKWNEQISTILSLRAESMSYSANLPAEVAQASATHRVVAERNGNKQLGSGSLSVVYRPTNTTRLYTTYQRGTALQPGQGGTINSKSNFADAELKEIGAKFSLLDARLFAGLSAYKWESARFNDRENRAERLRGQGVELEVTWAPTDQLSVIASTGSQRVIRIDPLGFRARYGTADRIAMESGAFDAGVAPTPPLNPQLIYPGTPESQAKLDVAWQATPTWGGSIGVIWSYAFFHNFERNLVLPSSMVWRSSIHWRHGPLTLRLSAENLFNADYYLGADPYFSHNDLVTKAPPLTLQLAAGWNF
ncbi:MAG: TonB-dependent receptor [Cephaloticoccus sp.]|nr:TonB-dependent receptor [Cephaloticoccus sp.]MCF7760820.1 TonB-dependent receptor [Cephaloticoccus sp.]